MASGVVKSFHRAKGYGFVTRDDGRDAFVHAASLADGVKELQRFQRVVFELEEHVKGLRAVEVRAVDDQ